MLLDISSALKNPGQIFDFSMEIALDSKDIYGQTYSIDTIEVDGIYTTVDDDVLVSGTIFFELYTNCARCLKEISEQFNVEFSETFKQNTYREADEEDLFDEECFFYDGYQLDLKDMIDQIILTNIPIKMVCGNECVNPVSQYDEVVQEKSSETDNPFNVLKNVFKNDEEV